MKIETCEDAENKLFDSEDAKKKYLQRVYQIKVVPGKKIVDILTEILTEYLKRYNENDKCRLTRVYDLAGNLVEPDGTRLTKGPFFAILSSLSCVQYAEELRYLLVPCSESARSKRRYGVPCRRRTLEFKWGDVDASELAEKLSFVPEAAEMNDVVPDGAPVKTIKKQLRYIVAKYVNPENCDESGYRFGEIAASCEEGYEKFDEFIMQLAAKVQQREEERKRKDLKARIGLPLTQEEKLDLFLGDDAVDSYESTDDKTVLEEPDDLTDDENKEG